MSARDQRLSAADTRDWRVRGSIDPTHRLAMIVNSVVLKALVGRRMADVGAAKGEGHDGQT